MDDQEERIEIVVPHNALTLPNDDAFLEEAGVSVPQTSYEPELGQALFGSAHSEFDLGENEQYTAEKLYELSEIIGKKNPDAQAHGFLGGEWGYGQDFVNDVFETHPYWWGDCTCGVSCPKHDENCDLVAKHDEWLDRQCAFSAVGEPDEFGLQQLDFSKMEEFAEKNPHPPCTCGAEAFWMDGDKHEEDCFSERFMREDDRLNETDPDLDFKEKDKRLLAWAAENGVEAEFIDGLFYVCTCGFAESEAAWYESHPHASDCREVLPNFRYGDLEIRWYKYIGRGMSVNREVTREELRRIFRKCRQSLQ